MPMREEFREEWVKAGYISEMGSAEVLLPPTADWVRLYHLTKAEHALDNIRRGRLKVATFPEVNDPFELMALNLKDGRLRRAVMDFRNEHDSNTGLLCFSANWTDPVLWGHYGDKHRGICLGFNLHRERRKPQKVAYIEKRVTEIMDDKGVLTGLDDDMKQILLSTKYKHWQYEEEHRVFVALRDAVVDGGRYFCKFDREFELVEIILGPLCTDPLDDVRTIVEPLYPGAKTFRSRLAIKHYAVVPDETTV